MTHRENRKDLQGGGYAVQKKHVLHERRGEVRLDARDHALRSGTQRGATRNRSRNVEEFHARELEPTGYPKKFDVSNVQAVVRRVSAQTNRVGTDGKQKTPSGEVKGTKRPSALPSRRTRTRTCCVSQIQTLFYL